jgi:Bacterial Alpha-2-macroglobulin MG10 domain
LNKKRVALLFDLNKMGAELNLALTKLEKMQTINGGWPWFTGCPEDWYITQYIITGFGHLQKLGVIKPEQNERVFAMINKALLFCDDKLQENFERTKRYNKNYRKQNNLSYMAVQYLYMRSYFKETEIKSRSKEAFEYYKKQAQAYWLSNSRYLQGMIALSLNRYKDKKTPMAILRSLKENALTNEEMGMYWKDNYRGYYWYQAPIEMQALMIEAFDEVANDLNSVDNLKTWLIKSKQTQNWTTTRATTEAVYALLLRGTDWLSTETNLDISIGDIKLDLKNDPDLKIENGTGYFKKTYTGTDINPSLGKVKITKKDAGVSWGSIYWQYFEQLDKITAHETPLKLTKKLFIETNSASGPIIIPVSETNVLKIGDKVKIRIELRVDRDMEYVHLKDMRAAGFEPVNILSGYRYQDGLGYYESTKDASTNFFMSYLPKGTYVFEYSVLVSHAGNFSNGISSIQCMYAPEFTSHSVGIRVNTEQKN